MKLLNWAIITNLILLIIVLTIKTFTSYQENLGRLFSSTKSFS